MSPRELRLQSCDNMDATHLQQTIQSLKDVDAWGMLDRVVIQKCTPLDYETALEAIGAEKLHFLDR